MQRPMLGSKIHRATVTHSEVDYEGSCAIDAKLLREAGICQFQQIEIYNVSNGERFTTYAIEAAVGSGIISINGAAAWKAKPDDIVIIVAYVYVNETEITTFRSKLVYVDQENSITNIKK